MPNEIKAGSVVQLKSGGARMTVEVITDGHAVCVWHEGKKPVRESYAVATLKDAGSSVKMADDDDD